MGKGQEYLSENLVTISTSTWVERENILQNCTSKLYPYKYKMHLFLVCVHGNPFLIPPYK